jgi:hypothetical protein
LDLVAHQVHHHQDGVQQVQQHQQVEVDGEHQQLQQVQDLVEDGDQHPAQVQVVDGELALLHQQVVVGDLLADHHQVGVALVDHRQVGDPVVLHHHHQDGDHQVRAHHLVVDGDPHHQEVVKVVALALDHQHRVDHQAVGALRQVDQLYHGAIVDLVAAVVVIPFCFIYPFYLTTKIVVMIYQL